MEGELSVVSKQKQYSLSKVPILVEGDIATDMEEVKKVLHILSLDGYKNNKARTLIFDNHYFHFYYRTCFGWVSVGTFFPTRDGNTIQFTTT